MIKRILPLSIAIITAGSSLAFNVKRPLLQSTDLEPYSSSILKTHNGSVKSSAFTRAGEGDSNSIDFSLAGEWGNAFKLNGVSAGDEVYLAFEMSKENTKVFADDEITSINITTGVFVANNIETNKVIDVNVFIIEDDIEKAPVYKQAGVLGDKPYTEYKVTLDTPYKITEGKNFFVGYSFKVPTGNQYYVSTDYMYPETTDGCWIGTVKDKTISWDNLAEEIGSLCIGCTIAGENFPQNNVSLLNIAGTPYTEPGKEFTYHFYIQNKGQSASEIEMTYVIGNAAVKTEKISLNKKLSYGETDIFEMQLVCDEEKTGIPMTFTISKVDGVENNSKYTTMSGTIDCYSSSKGFPRVHLIEEGTGTWCGWCPRGIVMMEYIAEKYPDFFARAAIHKSYGTSRDPMQVSTPLEVANTYMSGFPFAFINRDYVLETMSEEEIDEYVEAYKDIPSELGFSELSAKVNEEHNVVVDTKIRFSFDMTNENRYRLAYYIVEDGLGPYSQSNYYAGGAYGNMGGWGKKGQTVKTIYNDVARYLLGGVNGLSNSIPEELKADVDYSYTAELPVSEVSGNEFTLIAFVVDNKTGLVANAKQIKVENPFAAIENINASDAEIVLRKYHNLNGVEVTEPSNGIYIVTTVYSDGSVKHSKEIFK